MSDSSSPLSAGPPHPSASAGRSQGSCLSLCEGQGPSPIDWASKPGGLPPAAAPPRGTQAPRRGRTLFRGEEGVLRRTGTPYTLGLRAPCQALSSLKNSVFRTVLASQQSGGRFRGLPTAPPAPTRPARRPRPHGHAAVTQSPQLASGSRSLSRAREFGQRSSDTRPPLWRHTEYPAAPKTLCAPPVHPGPAPAPRRPLLLVPPRSSAFSRAPRSRNPARGLSGRASPASPAPFRGRWLTPFQRRVTPRRLGDQSPRSLTASR